MTQPTAVSLVSLITEITLRCTAQVCIGFTPDRIEAVAEPLATGLVDMVVMQAEKGIEDKDFTVHAPDFHCFELWSQIIDLIEKEIPVAARIEIKAVVTRSQRTNFLSGKWKGESMTRREIARLHPKTDGYTGPR